MALAITNAGVAEGSELGLVFTSKKDFLQPTPIKAAIPSM
jgi:hypothetical protein